jgi:SAM-dependent methyltransferase
MGFYNDQILPRLVHWTMRGKPINEARQRTLARAAGSVLEIGFGSGLNLRHYPRGVTGLMIVEPSRVARGIAAKAIAGAPFPTAFVGLDGQHLVLEAGSVDCAVSTWTLCTIPDAGRALEEVARVLKPGGRFLFVEHGLSPDAGVAKWQHRLDGLQGRVAGGCHLDRDMEALIGASPLKIDSLEKFYIKGPKTHAYMYLGEAGKRE